jgi:hypothetical protein
VDTGLVLITLFLNATIPLTFWFWRSVSRDEYLGFVPARSGAPLLLAFPAAVDATLLASAITGYRSERVFVAVLGAGWVLVLSTWIARFPAWAIPPKLRHTERMRHDLGVYCVDETEGAEEPYYVAICSCGWSGDTFPDREHAELQANRHRPEVDPQLRRPGDVGSAHAPALTATGATVHFIAKSTVLVAIGALTLIAVPIAVYFTARGSSTAVWILCGVTALAAFGFGIVAQSLLKGQVVLLSALGAGAFVLLKLVPSEAQAVIWSALGGLAYSGLANFGRMLVKDDEYRATVVANLHKPGWH